MASEPPVRPIAAMAWDNLALSMDPAHQRTPARAELLPIPLEPSCA